jgi:hypothetical protein
MESKTRRAPVKKEGREKIPPPAKVLKHKGLDSEKAGGKQETRKERIARLEAEVRALKGDTHTSGTCGEPENED